MSRPADFSPKTLARITGALYLLTIVFGGLGESIHGRLVVSGDASATATNIATHSALLRIGFASYMMEAACLIAVTALFYELLKPVSRSASLVAALISLVGIAIKTTSRLFYVAPLSLVGNPSYLTVFDAEQRQALSLLLLKVNAQGAGIALIFFGVSAVIKNTLIVKSTFLPRILGVIGILAGLGWLTFLAPPLADRVYPYVVALGLLASAAQIGWLLVFGVDEQRWKDQAAHA
jgi:Domain of unknown function (DUF4386)